MSKEQEITGTENPERSNQSATKDEVRQLNNLMIGVVVVLAIAAGGLLTNYLAAKQASYENLQDEVQSQNDKIEDLTKEVHLLTQQKSLDISKPQ